MGVGYQLVNHSKKEIISFLHIPVNTAREISGNPVGAAMVTWYLLQNPGDRISFVSDTYDDWPFDSDYRNEMPDYTDVTDQVVNSLIEAEILVDEGKEWEDEDEPETVYMRALRNIWKKG